MQKIIKILLVTLIFISPFSFATTTNTNPAPTENAIFQVATLSSLARGVYDGDVRYGELFAKGNQGLGTFEALDGEMVAVDGEYYQISASGKLRKVGPNEIVPFAEVINFSATHNEKVKNINDYNALQAKLDAAISNKNIPYAIRIDGAFSKLQLRSVAKQKKPYPPLIEAVKNQAIFNLENISGTIVGFWFPEYWSGIAVPGYHLHFVAADRSIGGHVLELAIDNANVATAASHDFSIYLPKTKSFAAADLNPKELHQEIKAAKTTSK